MVLIDERLRAETLASIDAAREVLKSQLTPPPTADAKRCKACSLADLCAPDVVRKDRSIRYAQMLFEVAP